MLFYKSFSIYILLQFREKWPSYEIGRYREKGTNVWKSPPVKFEIDSLTSWLTNQDVQFNLGFFSEKAFLIKRSRM